MNEIETKAAFDAQHALIDGRVFIALDVTHAVGFLVDIHHYLAANPAVGTNGFDRLEHFDPSMGFVAFIDQSTRRTHLHTRPALHAVGVSHQLAIMKHRPAL